MFDPSIEGMPIVKCDIPLESLDVQRMSDGGGLVFDHRTGATTYIDSDALVLLDRLIAIGPVSSDVLFQDVQDVFFDQAGFDQTLGLLEKSYLIFRC